MNVWVERRVLFEIRCLTEKDGFTESRSWMFPIGWWWCYSVQQRCGRWSWKWKSFTPTPFNVQVRTALGLYPLSWRQPVEVYSWSRSCSDSTCQRCMLCEVLREHTSMCAVPPPPRQLIEYHHRRVINPRQTHDLVCHYRSLHRWKEQHHLVWFLLSHGFSNTVADNDCDAKRTTCSLCNCTEPHLKKKKNPASFLEEWKNKRVIYLLGVKANLCLHNSQYSFRLCFSHCTKLGKHRKGTEHRVRVHIQNKADVSCLLFFVAGTRDQAFQPRSVLLQTELTPQQDFTHCLSSGFKNMMGHKLH